MVKKIVKVGSLSLGDGKIYVQSMLNKSSDDIEGNVLQAQELFNAGCEIIRVSIPKREDVKLIHELKKALTIPVVADIHYDYKIAVDAVNAGADKIRINPGNIGAKDKVKEVVRACRLHGVPIRIGVNGGSLEKDILIKYGKPTAEALVESALNHVKLLNNLDFDEIIISLKSSNVKLTIDAYRKLHELSSYPLHLGITESGTERIGIIKSAIGIGSLLTDGIGDTIRVSLTADPIKEIYAAKDILKALGLLENTVEIISCPTCGRTKIDIIRLAGEVEEATSNLKRTLKIAVMGCAVNGPGEAKEADIGIAGGDGEGIIFKKGEIFKKVPEKELLKELISEINKEC